MQVKLADGELERLEHKLFVGMLPASCSEADLFTLFGTFGGVREVFLHTWPTGQPKGAAFVKMNSRRGAEQAIESLNGVHRMEVGRSVFGKKTGVFLS